MVKKWEKIESKLLQHFRIFTLRQDTSQSPRTGQLHNFFVLDTPDWINIIAITPDEKVVMIHQYRHGTGEVCLEIPGGMVDEGEDRLVAAVRELREETGYEAENWQHIGMVHPNPAFLNNRCDTFLALNARCVTETHFDSAEDIAVEEIPLADIPHLIKSGQITHGIVIAAFYHYDNQQAAGNNRAA